MINKLGAFRDIQNDDLEMILSWRNSSSVRQNMYTRHEISFEEHQKWWKVASESNDQRYFIYEHDDKPLGVVSFTQININDSNSSWAFYASPDAPRGTGSRMEFLALEKAFKGMNLHKLYCEVLSFNEPVVKLHKKFGFRLEGGFKEHHQVDGTYVDVIRLGILRSEWESIREVMLDKLTFQR